MLQAIFWLIIGFVIGVLYNERLARHRPNSHDVRASSIPASSQRESEQAAPPLPSPALETPPAPTKAHAGKETPPERDDLTTIKGIGATFSQRLNEAGINTFAKLVDTAPADLRVITRIREWQKPAPEDWIAEARSLLSSSA